MAKELQLSIAIIVICSLLAGILFAYITKELGIRAEKGGLSIVPSFIGVFVGYIMVVVVLAIFFAHRFIGPFERLKVEIKLILAGNYHRRLCVRNSDDFYIRSFIMEVNKLLERLDKECKVLDKDKFRKDLDSELFNIIALLEKNASKEKLREALILFHSKYNILLGFKEKK